MKSEVFSKREPFGIDLGTTNSCIATMVQGVPQVIRLKSGKNTMPSCVMWNGGDNFIVGEEAYEKRDQANVAYSMKRMIGTDDKKTLHFDGEERALTPVEFSSLVLKNLVEQASEFYPNIHDVVITVPAHFNDKEIEDTIQAGKGAGLNVLQILREPTAAALLYDDEDADQSKILVYDLGGGTFDVSMVEIVKRDPEVLKKANQVYGINIPIEEGVPDKSFLVRKNDGDMRLGGDDIDGIVLSLMLSSVEKKGLDVKKIPPSRLEWLRLQAESAKKRTSFIKVDIPFSYVEEGTNLEKEVDITVTKQDVDKAVEMIYQKTKKITEGILLGENQKELTSIILVGGSTKSGTLKKCLRRDFPAIVVNDSLNPDEAVALGAAVQAARILFKDTKLMLQDVTPLALGVEADGRVQPIIPKNTPIPFSKTEVFTTLVDDQTTIRVNVYQGNSTFVEECVYLGTLVVDGLEKKPAGEASIDVTLQSDSNGLLRLQVKVDGKLESVQLKNLLGSSGETKKLSATEKRVLVWTKKIQEIKDAKIRDEGLEILERVREGDTAALKDINTFMYENIITRV